MDSANQAAGEKRVMALLVDKLDALGFMKPSTMKVDQFDAMRAELCAKLAYMSEVNIEALAEVAAGMGTGKARDRWPIAQKVLDRAVEIQAPPDDASPLIRSVFAHDLGRSAIEQGWAPELLRHVRRIRLFPKDYAVNQVMGEARDNVRRLRGLDQRLAGGGELSPEEMQWRDRRLAALQKCRDIAALGERERGAA